MRANAIQQQHIITNKKMEKNEIEQDTIKTIDKSTKAAAKVLQSLSYEHNIYDKERCAEYVNKAKKSILEPADYLTYLDSENSYIFCQSKHKKNPKISVHNILGHFWADNIFKPIITITFYLNNYYAPFLRIYLEPDKILYSKLRNSLDLKLIFVCESGYMTICRLSLGAYFKEFLDPHVVEYTDKYVKKRIALSNIDLARYKAHISINNSIRLYKSSNQFLLTKSYIEKIEIEFEKIDAIYKKYKDFKIERINDFITGFLDKSEHVNRYYKKNNWLECLVIIIDEHIHKFSDCVELWNTLFKLADDPELDLYQKTDICSLLSSIFHCGIYSPKLTSMGQNMVSQDIENKLYIYPINHSEYQSDNIENFWKNLPWLLMPFYKETLGSGDLPVPIDNYYDTVPSWEGDVEEAQEITKTLLSEAFYLKQNTIPYGAYHPLDEALYFKAIKLFEIGDEVIALLISQKGEFLMITCCPRIGKFFVRVDNETSAWDKDNNTVLATKRMNQFVTGISFLLAHLIRDFWVVEERNSNMSSRPSGRRDFSLKSDKKTKCVIYLPRIRYVGRNYDSDNKLNLANRKPHFVTGHLRKAAVASGKQLAFAKKFSIHIPEGFTFVQPHSRGGASQEIHYRSISALKCIKAINSTNTNGDDDWFSFELNTKNWLQHNGYDVIHASASRNGDGGVDIQAFKEGEHLIVQCKYWSNRIGPDVVRELMGTLKLHPQGARGVIVTSDQLTSGAKELALAESIQFLENVNFKSEFRNLIK